MHGMSHKGAWSAQRAHHPGPRGSPQSVGFSTDQRSPASCTASTRLVVNPASGLCFCMYMGCVSACTWLTVSASYPRLRVTRGCAIAGSAPLRRRSRAGPRRPHRTAPPPATRAACPRRRCARRRGDGAAPALYAHLHQHLPPFWEAQSAPPSVDTAVP
eukprot:1214236-Pleurochrysis_carterae.AAC.3